MRAVVQRVSEAGVTVEGQLISRIDKGYMILLGISKDDTEEDIEWLCKKVANLRIFNDKDDKLNLSIKDVKGEILLISQFTLYADIKRGNRPGFSNAAFPDIAENYYFIFAKKLIEHGINVKLGVFGADMKVNLINDGPVTIIYDTKMK